MPKKFKWIIEVTVDESWVADGFDLSLEDRLEQWKEELIDYAMPHEVTARILKAPAPKKIRITQGYDN